MQSILIHYHEIALKRGNRPLFLRRLAQNLIRATSDLGSIEVDQLTGRLVLKLDEAVPPETIQERVSRVFGVANFSFARRVPSALDAIKSTIAEAIHGESPASFRVTARRAFQSFPATSTDLNRELGAFIQLRTGWRVDLTRPELNVHVEVLPDETFIYTRKLPGPGGLPVGVSGRVAALMSGGIDSPVAAWRMMKRGCRVVFVHFHSVPYLSAASKEKAMVLARHLTRYQYDSRLYLVPFGEIQREVVLAAPPPLRVVLYRRLMIRIAERLAQGEHCQALVTGESVGQVASQTLENLSRLNEVATLPVLRPLIGMDKEEITAQARAIGSFEISIEPDQDCCQLFVPKHPSTRTTREVIEKAEVGLDIEGFVTRGVAEAECRAMLQDFFRARRACARVGRRWPARRGCARRGRPGEVREPG